MKTTFNHKPVLLKEVLEAFDYLAKRNNAVFVDGTIGLAGHSTALILNLKSQISKLKIIGIDKDDRAIQNAKIKMQNLGMADLFVFAHDDFKNIDEILKQVQNDNLIETDKIDGVLLDLGLSSMQLDNKSRGFSFQDKNQPLDMRMDQQQIKTASAILNSYSLSELEKMLRRGEERRAKIIAKNIAAFRKVKKISRVGDLLEILEKSIPPKIQKTGKTHYSTATFRALRIEVNDELGSLEQAIFDMTKKLKVNSRLVIISFHSLEDRIVKQTFKLLANPCSCPPKLPYCVCGKKPTVKLISKKPIVPSEAEIKDNPRSRSAKLRVVEKI